LEGQSIILDSYKNENISSKVTLLTDPNKEITIKSLIDSTSSYSFRANPSSSIFLPANVNTLWIKIELKNNSEREQAAFIEIQNPSISQIEYFFLQNNMLIKLPPEGSSKPFPKWRHKNRYNLQQFFVEASTMTTCYIKLSNDNIPAVFSIMLYGDKGYIVHSQNDIVKSGIFYGILITLAFSALILILIGVGKTSFINYLFYSIASLILLINYDGIGFQFIFPNSIWIQHNIRFIIPLIMAALLIQQFIAISPDFCKERYRYCSFGSMVSFIAISMAIIRGFINFGFIFDIIIISLFGLITFFFIGFGIFYQENIKNKVHRTILLSIVFLIVAWYGIASVYFPIGLTSIESETVIKLFMMLHLILLFSALVYQIGIYQSVMETRSLNAIKNLSSYKEKVNIELERTVRERTKALQEANKKLNELVQHNQQITEQLLRQKEEIEKKNQELEMSFKKSSVQHIKIQKALMINVEQQQRLTEALQELQEKNKWLEQKNEEIDLQREKIREQNLLLEERARDITDSILYAERLQSAFFPPLQKVREIFPESFIFFQPKDILSGDIYWFDTVFSPNDNTQLKLAAAIDCTGHGIPGALMSIIARDILNDAIHNNYFNTANAIVNHMNKMIVNIFNKKNNTNHIKDGMDMALILVDEKNKQIYFSGARNPLILISNENIYSIKGHIYSVGTVSGDQDQQRIEFPQHTISYNTGDMVYLFSDGYSDQFGGEKGNKFRTQRLVNLFHTIHKKSIYEQETILTKTFYDWKNGFEQVDDILVIGIRL